MKDIIYTCKTDLVPHQKDGEPVVAIRVSNYNDVIFHHVGGPANLNFITGPIADKLYAYEELGFSPVELKAVVEKYRKDMALRIAVNSVYGTMGLTKEAFNLVYKDMESIEDIQRKSAAYEKILVYQNQEKQRKRMEIKKVIFNDPATIVFWADGTKTVVKATNEPFDPEKGLAMAISKRALGDKGNYFEVFKKHIPEKPKPDGVKKRSGKHPWGYKEEKK